MRNLATGKPTDTGRKAVVAALVRSAEVENALYRALADHPEVELKARHLEDFDITDCQALRGDILMLDIDPSSRQELALLTDFVAQRRGTPVIVTAPWLDVNSMFQLMRLGVHHIVPQPIVPAQLVDVVEQARTRPREAAAGAEAEKGLVVAVMGSCGGVGATSVAVQAACALTRREPSPGTCLIDLDIQFGTAALQLDIEPRGNVIDLMRESGRLDGAMLRGAMARAAGGKFDLLAAPTSFHPLDNIEPERIAALIELAREEYALTLLDVPLLWSHWTHAVVRCANRIVMVVQPTVQALRQGRRQLDMLHQEELDDIPLTAVLNRAENDIWHADGVAVKDAATALGRKIDYVLPESPAFKAAAQRGLPLGEVPGGRALERRIAALFDAVLRGEEPVSPLAGSLRLPPWLRGLRLPKLDAAKALLAAWS
jgi:pilus assembly protein CpaE